MVSHTIDQVAAQRIDKAARKWFLDKRVQIISNPMVRIAAAYILATLGADITTANPVRFTHTEGRYNAQDIVLRGVSGLSADDFANLITRALSRILRPHTGQMTYSEVDEQGLITFIYTAE
jgi:hypothetical protein